MRRYEQVSGAFFCLVAVVQLMRLVLHWPVQIADVAVPPSVSIVALVVASTLAIWAFRAGKSAA